jgi:hypothetical protein
MDAERTDLTAVESLYARGDFANARRLAREIAAEADSAPSDKARAKVILSATGVDPVAIGAFIATALVLVFLIAHYVF